MSATKKLFIDMGVKSKVILALLCCTLLQLSADTLEDSFKNGKFSGNLRTFWYDGQRELRNDRTALTFGGVLSYDTARMDGFGAHVSFFSSNGVLPVTKMPYSGATSNLKTDGTAINTLGEAYILYDTGRTLIKYGRQRLDTPLANDYYNRMLPNSFEALYIENKEFQDVILKVAHITGWKYKDSDMFVSPVHNYGISRSMEMVGASSKLGDFKIDLYDYHVADMVNSVYVQAENNRLVSFDNGAHILAAIQYLLQNGVGNKLLGLSSTDLFGIKFGVTHDDWTVTGLYTRVGDQSLQGSGGRGSKAAWSGFVTYTDLQVDGETENAGALAYGAVLTHRLSKALEVSVKYMQIRQSDGKQSAANSLVDNPRPNSQEYNLDATYQPSKQIRLRCRLSHLDYDPSSTVLYKSKAYDEYNTRVILDYLF